MVEASSQVSSKVPSSILVIDCYRVLFDTWLNSNAIFTRWRLTTVLHSFSDIDWKDGSDRMTLVCHRIVSPSSTINMHLEWDIITILRTIHTLTIKHRSTRKMIEQSAFLIVVRRGRIIGKHEHVQFSRVKTFAFLSNTPYPLLSASSFTSWQAEVRCTTFHTQHLTRRRRTKTMNTIKKDSSQMAVICALWRRQTIEWRPRHDIAGFCYSLARLSCRCFRIRRFYFNSASAIQALCHWAGMKIYCSLTKPFANWANNVQASLVLLTIVIPMMMTQCAAQQKFMPVVVVEWV